MAGGKETPRQKMIGMMYLVLTALLALNVSNAVLEKFAIIEVTLSDLINENTSKNVATQASIQKANVTGVKEDKAKVQAQQVRDLTAKTITQLNELKDKLKREPGQAGKEGAVIPAEELVLNTNNSEELMLNSKAPEAGNNYEKALDGYVKELNSITSFSSQFPKLTKTAKDYDAFKNGPHATKPFLEFSFEGVPTMAAIATISQMESEILEYEKTALDSLLKRVKANVYEVDKMVPMVKAESNTLVAGQTYEGMLFVAGAASGANPQMSYNGVNIPVTDQDVGNGVIIKMGKIKFPVRATSYNAVGVAEGSFNVKVTLPGMATMEQPVKYKILKPNPEFSSAATSALYINCGNEVNVTIQGLTDLSTLELGVDPSEGSKIKLGSGKFVIIPTRPLCHVRVTLDGIEIANKVFNSNPVPIPVPRVMYGSTTYDDAVGLPGNSTFRIEPEILQPDFLTNLKKDAGYQVVSFTLKVRGSPSIVKGSSYNLTPLNLKSGDVIEVLNVKVQRTTYDGKSVDVLGNKMGKLIKIK